jgi:hypothetical protein
LNAFSLHSLINHSKGLRAAKTQVRCVLAYQRADSHLLEGTVMLLLASPLLAIAGFYDPPFKESIQIILDDREEVLQGRIDILVLQNKLWVVVLE